MDAEDAEGAEKRRGRAEKTMEMEQNETRRTENYRRRKEERGKKREV